MSKRILMWLSVCVLVVGAAAVAEAGVERRLSYQGELRDLDGNLVADGEYNITFTIYDSSVAGQVLYWENQMVIVTGGRFTAQIGDSSLVRGPGDPFDGINTTLIKKPANIAYTGPGPNALYLGIAVNGDEEIYPRRRITSALTAYGAVKVFGPSMVGSGFVIVGTEGYEGLDTNFDGRVDKNEALGEGPLVLLADSFSRLLKKSV